MHAIAGLSPGDSLRGRECHYSAADTGRDGLLEYETPGTYADVRAKSGAVDRFVGAAREAAGGARAGDDGSGDRRYHD